MMGYPEGWVTDTLTNRTQSLKALGNAVVPQCAAEAFTQLHNRITHATT
jgi:site-specific DNA-cytosine methylase